MATMTVKSTDKYSLLAKEALEIMFKRSGVDKKF